MEIENQSCDVGKTIINTLIIPCFMNIMLSGTVYRTSCSGSAVYETNFFDVSHDFFKLVCSCKRCINLKKQTDLIQENESALLKHLPRKLNIDHSTHL